MVESTTFILGLAAGLLFGGLAGGLWWSTRLRTQFEAKVTGAAERAQRAETLAEELRRRGFGCLADPGGMIRK